VISAGIAHSVCTGNPYDIASNQRDCQQQTYPQRFGKVCFEATADRSTAINYNDVDGQPAAAMASAGASPPGYAALQVPGRQPVRLTVHCPTDLSCSTPYSVLLYGVEARLRQHVQERPMVNG
jgi:hypothetical protein